MPSLKTISDYLSQPPAVALHDRVQVVIKTFERPHLLRNLLDSIERFYPDLKVIVADDSAEPSIPKRAQEMILKLPFDTGLKAGRQIAMGCVTTEYYLLLDDDFLFIERTKIEDLVSLADAHQMDIVGGLVEDYGKGEPRNCAGCFVVNDRILGSTGPRPSAIPDMLDVDYVANFYLARTNTIRRMGGYDCRLKIGGHMELFLRAKQRGVRVGCCTTVTIEHWPEYEASYRWFRDRCTEKFSQFWDPIARTEYGFIEFPP